MTVAERVIRWQIIAAPYLDLVDDVESRDAAVSVLRECERAEPDGQFVAFPYRVGGGIVGPPIGPRFWAVDFAEVE